MTVCRSSLDSIVFDSIAFFDYFAVCCTSVPLELCSYSACCGADDKIGWSCLETMADETCCSSVPPYTSVVEGGWCAVSTDVVDETNVLVVNVASKSSEELL